MSYHVVVVDLLSSRAPGVHVAVDQAHLGEVIAAVLAVRVLLQVKVVALAATAEAIPGDAWPSAIRRIVAQVTAAFPTPAEIGGGVDPHLAAQTAAAAVPGGADVLGSPAASSRCSGPAGPSLMFCSIRSPPPAALPASRRTDPGWLRCELAASRPIRLA